MPGTIDDRVLTAGMRRYTVVVLTAVYMLNFVDRQIPAILLPAIRDEFRVSDTVLGLMTGPAFAVFYVTVGIPVARIADRFNRRNLIATALALWSAMTAVSGLAANAAQLVLARIGVGIGEAGCSPPAHSIIADLYAPHERSAAMGIYSLGISAGIMLALFVGGWMAENIGWRQAFFVAGLPGLLLAAVVRFTMAEPVRGAVEKRQDSRKQPDLAVAFAYMLRCRTLLYVALAASLASFVGYSIVNFMPSFLARSYGTPLATAGLWLGLIYGVAGGAGLYLGGRFADRIARTSQPRVLRFIAATTLVSMPLYLATFLAATRWSALLLLVAPTIFSYAYLAPVLSQVQSLVALRMRAVASATVLLLINIVGLGFGPLITGLISDVLQAQFGDESLRYSLSTVTAVVLPAAALCFVKAGQTVEADLAHAATHD